jgi:signal transduction histidine kinase
MMAIPVARSAAPTWPRLPRRTARLRLTFLYGGLFLACGAILLAVSYVLVRQAIAPWGGHVLEGGLSQSAGPGFKSRPPNDRGGNGNVGGFSQVKIPVPASLITVHRGSHALTPGQVHSLMLTLGKEIASSDLRQTLIDAPIALAIVTVIALALGWFAAGRVLHPLATITAAARRISASNLNQRLALRGPDDELKALGDTLDELFARLEAAFDAQRHFAANASHELRTPLTRERPMLQVALDDPATTAGTWRGVAAEVLASNAEQESLIEALLALASGEGGLGQREPVDLAAITGQILRARRADLGHQGLRVQAAVRPAALDGDPLLTERLVANLIDNAARHNIAGGHVEISTATTDGRAVLTVANTGPAIPPEAVGRLFQPFLRLDRRRIHHDNGHGLGLSIVRAIAAAHGASITARARPGGGLAIDVTFPPAASADGNPSEPSAPGDRLRVR